MRIQSVLLACVLASSSVACLRSTAFHCETSADCGAGGTCQQDIGFCSVSDGACESQQRYGDAAGGVAGQCVPVIGTIDAPVPVDGADDAPVDAPVVGCPTGYNAITGGQTGHLYRLVTSTANWPNQRDFCTATTTSAYLAIPGDEAELAALVELATSTQFWVGITDQVTEGTWLDVKDAPQTFLPWATSSPNTSGNNNDDCVLAMDNGGATATIRDERCGSTQLPGICECEP